MTKSTRLAAALTVLALVAPIAPAALACQQPPGSEVPCRLVPQSPVVSGTDPFQVYFTVINMPVTPPFPPPYLDDLPFQVSAYGGASPPGTTCRSTQPGETTVDPASYTVQLDEVWSPFADEPTSHTQTLTVTPGSPAELYSITAQACAFGPACQRWCSTSVCIAVDPPESGNPYAEFQAPIQQGPAGSVLPFSLLVHRNGYDPAPPLTVRVRPENFSDPIDIFPLSPPSLSTTGVTVTGDDEVVAFTCSTHFPCFVGVDNAYHVTLHDGTTLLWDSSIDASTGIGRALVDRSPLVRQELVEVLDDSGNGEITTGEHAILHLRLYARNPFFAAALDAAALETAIPADLTVIGHELHFHDNPMDAYDPTPAELAAAGTVSTPAGSFRVDVATIEARFSAPPFDPPPTVFRDLFEVELLVETPPEGLSEARDLVFPGLTVTATAGASSKTETSAPITVAVRALRPPNPVLPLYALKELPGDVRFRWDDPAADSGHAPAEIYRLFRSASPGSGFLDFLTVPDSGATREEGTDPGALDASEVRYYRIVAENSDGDSGDRP